jgi:hypothetical protein
MIRIIIAHAEWLRPDWGSLLGTVLARVKPLPPKRLQSSNRQQRAYVLIEKHANMMKRLLVLLQVWWLSAFLQSGWRALSLKVQ